MAFTYFDYNATTSLDPRVLNAMLPYLQESYGNPSSVHRYGRLARTVIDDAREKVAQLVNVHPQQVIFTSGGSEANNLAIKGAAANLASGTIVISAIEHDAVLKPAYALTHLGWRVKELPVDAQGTVILQPLPADTRIVSVMLANNENGVIQDIYSIAQQAHANNILMHTDAVQAAGKIVVDFVALGVSMLTLSAHKIQGPQGVGALIVERTIPLLPLIHGGGQEGGLRSGTENVAAIVGFGKAAELAKLELELRAAKMQQLQYKLESGLKTIPGIVILSEKAKRLPNTTLFSVPGFDGEMLLMLLDMQGFAVSSGSACASGTGKPSHVLQAMAVPEELAQCVIRVSVGPQNTVDEIDAFLNYLQQQLSKHKFSALL